MISSTPGTGSEMSLYQLLMNIPAIIAIFKGPDHRFEFANPLCIEIIGKDRPAIGKPIREVLPELQEQGIYELLDNVYNTGVSYTSEERRIQFADKLGVLKDYYFKFIYQPMRSEAGQVEGIFLHAIDITDSVLSRKKLEKAEERLEEQVRVRTVQLEKLNNDLLFTNEQLRQFAYVASHDLQEPLRKINMFCDKLMYNRTEILSVEGQKYFEKIMSAAKRMSTLINDLLNFTRLDAREENFVPVNLNDIADKVKEDYEILISQKSAVIHIGRLFTVEAAPLQMNQLIYNLMGNALKFSKDGIPPVINITSNLLSQEEASSFDTLDPAREYCEIIFSDNGIGFDQQFSSKIFEIFQRLNGKTQYEGTGIGLALCKKIVDYHKGEIYAMSQIGEGASFHIILPLHHR